jgi:hypothetical protein
MIEYLDVGNFKKGEGKGNVQYIRSHEGTPYKIRLVAFHSTYFGFPFVVASLYGSIVPLGES